MAVDLLAGQSPSVRCAICAQPAPARRPRCASSARRRCSAPGTCRACVPSTSAAPGRCPEFLGDPVGRSDSQASVRTRSRARRVANPGRLGRPTRRSSRSAWPCASPDISRWVTTRRGSALGPTTAGTGNARRMREVKEPAAAAFAGRRCGGPSRRSGLRRGSRSSAPRLPATRASPEHKPPRDAKAASPAFPPLDARDVTEGGSRSQSFPNPPPPVVAVAAPPEPAVPDRCATRCLRARELRARELHRGHRLRERARLQYCEGEWGKAPQCPAGAARNTR